MPARPVTRLGLAVTAVVGGAVVAAALPAPATASPAPPVAPGAATLGVLAKPSAAVANARIAATMRLRVRDARLGRNVGAYVWDVGLNRSVFQQNRAVGYLPASNMKIVTSVVALQTMGPATRFPTYVRLGTLTPGPVVPPPVGPTPVSSPSPGPTATGLTVGPPAPTVARTASLTVVAGGDPLTSSADLRALARQAAAGAKAAGATRADLRLDDRLFPAPTSAPGWTRGYTPYVVRPVRPFVRDNRLGVDVATDAATYLATALTAAGLPTTYRGRAALPPGTRSIAMLRGHTVAQAVAAMLPPSDNQIAEMLFLLSAARKGRTATWANGARTAREVLTALRVPLTGVVLADGSGVSRADRLTSQALVTVLRRTLDPAFPNLRPLYYDRVLPVAGRTGTLRSRFLSGPSRCARGIVVAKTGTLFDVVSLSGVTKGADGSLKVFAFLVNRYPTRYDKSRVRTAVDELAASVTGCY